jgi:hypothetical protein
MKTLRILTGLLILSALVIMGCGPQAHIQKVPGVDLGDYKTYSWLEPGEQNKKGKAYKNFEESYLKKSIAEQLEKKGFREVKGDADVSIDYDVQVENSEYTRSQPIYSQPFMGYRYNPYYRRVQRVYYPSRYLGTDYRQVPYKSGTITVNLVDNKTNEVTWQGWAETEVDRKKLSTDEIDGIVVAIFKKFKN